MDKNKTNAGDRLEGGDDEDDGDYILLNSNFCSGTNRKLSVIHPGIILDYYKFFRDYFKERPLIFSFTSSSVHNCNTVDCV